jgi:hypothetical protein
MGVVLLGYFQKAVAFIDMTNGLGPDRQLSQKNLLKQACADLSHINQSLNSQKIPPLKVRREFFPAKMSEITSSSA